MPAPSPVLPYRISVLCYLFDVEGRLLLLHRRKPPNRDLYSPIGGKLEMGVGESPTACAQREIREEAGVEVDVGDLHLAGMVSEQAFEGEGHWLMFLYECTRPVELSPDLMQIEEGRLEWHSRESIEGLTIPETDRRVIFPMFWANRGRFFALHIDCSGEELSWRVEQ
jgi:8-oxo-dGTP diphosphatase